MKADFDSNGVLHISSESVLESLVLKAWLKEYQVTNVNGVNMIPSRGMICHPNTTQNQE